MILKHSLVYNKHLGISVRCQQGKNGHFSLVSNWCYFWTDMPERMQLFSLLCHCNPSNFGSPTSLDYNRLLPWNELYFPLGKKYVITILM